MASRTHLVHARVLEDESSITGNATNPQPGSDAGRETAAYLSSAHATQRVRKNFWIASAVVAFTVIVFVLWLVFSLGGTRTTAEFDEIGEGIAALAGGIMCLVGSRRSQSRTRLAWLFIAAGCFSWAAGQGAWCWYDVGENVVVPFPGLPDLGFLAEVPLFITGVLLFPGSTENTLSRWRVGLDGVIIGGSILAISWGTVLGAAYHAGGGSTYSRVIGLAYPLSDVAVTTIAFSMLGRIDRKYRLTLGLIIGALTVISLSDSAYLYLTQTTNYANRDLVDGGWVAGFLVLGLASLWPNSQQSADGDERRLLSNWQVILPYIFLGSAAAFIITKYFLNRHLDAFLATDGLGLVAIVLARQVVTLLEDTQLTRSLERQTKIDPLTTIGNRLMFAERVGKILASSESTGGQLAVLICDLDNFKYVNDKLGHSTGDLLLVEVAKRLVHSVRTGDLVVRLGGDEFAVVLDSTTTTDQAVGVAVRVIDAMQEPVQDFSERYVPHMSVGIAIEPLLGASGQEVLRDADVALYAAKNAGGNCYRLFEASMGIAHFDKLNFYADFSSVLENGEFDIEYEPIVQISSGKPIGAEALIRWRHPTRGQLAPTEFLELAESSGAIVAIGRWVLEQALGQVREWRSRIPGAGDLWMAVNISARQLESDEFVSSLVEVLEQIKVDPSSLHLELTETEIVHRDRSSIEQLHSLRALGIQLAIDDFGTGYSSLSYLKHLPVNALKIDRAFIAELDSDPYDEMIVQSVIALAYARGFEVIAEGIETDSQLERLRSMGCGLGQGFLWARPQPAEAFGRWLEERLSTATAAPSTTTAVRNTHERP